MFIFFYVNYLNHYLYSHALFTSIYFVAIFEILQSSFLFWMLFGIIQPVQSLCSGLVRIFLLRTLFLFRLICNFFILSSALVRIFFFYYEHFLFWLSYNLFILSATLVRTFMAQSNDQTKRRVIKLPLQMPQTSTKALSNVCTSL